MTSKGTKVLALMVRDPKFLRHVISQDVDVDVFFPDPVDNFIARAIFPLGKKYGMITDTMLATEFSSYEGVIPPSVSAHPGIVRERCSSIFFEQHPDLDWVHDSVDREIRLAKYDKMLRKSAEHIEAGNLEEVDKIWTPANLQGMLQAKHHGNPVTNAIDGLKMHLKNIRDGKYAGIQTGIPDLDNRFLWHGLGFKELTLVLAPPKRGKTMACIWFAYQASLRGHRVLYITLEVSEMVILTRLAQCHLRAVFDDLVQDPDSYIDRFQAWLTSPPRRVRGSRGVMPSPGEICILEAPTGSITAEEIAAVVREETMLGRKPNLLVVDYPKLCKFRPGLAGWEALGETVEIIRGCAVEFDLAVVAPAQGDKASTTKARLSHADVGYDFSQIATADTIIGLGKREENIPVDERGLPLPVAMDLSVPPSRNSISFVTRIETDYARGRFYIGGGDYSVK